MSDKTAYPIPRGWRRVTHGSTRKGDKSWNPRQEVFDSVLFIGWRVIDFYCIIRRVNGGAR